MNTKQLIEKAKTSKRHLALLNFGLARMIPFNKPHGFKIIAMGDDFVKVKIPYKRLNFNHIKGIHACALATASEYSTGLVLLNTLDAKKYRIIMQKMEMNYFYQAKMDTIVSFELEKGFIQNEILTPLESNESVVISCDALAKDIDGNHISTGTIFWQVKPWAKVRTKK